MFYIFHPFTSLSIYKAISIHPPYHAIHLQTHPSISIHSSCHPTRYSYFQPSTHTSFHPSFHPFFLPSHPSTNPFTHPLYHAIHSHIHPSFLSSIYHLHRPSIQCVPVPINSTLYALWSRAFTRSTAIRVKFTPLVSIRG